MKIVHFADTPLSAAPYRLMKVQRIAGVEARCISGSDHLGSRTTWTDLMVIRPEDHAEIRRVVGEADLIHFHNRCWKQRIFRVFPDLRKIVESKPKVLQFHSPRDQLMYDTPDSFVLKCPKLVVAQYQVRLYPEATPVPNVVPIDCLAHSPFKIHKGFGAPLCVGFSPSSRLDKGWDNKGYKVTKDILERLARERVAEYRIYTDLPIDACVRERRYCEIVIDEVMTGSYHMVSLEALTAGQVTIANLDSKTIDALEIITGTRVHPWVIADKSTLYKKLQELCSQRLYQSGSSLKEWEKIQIASRAYMEKYWEPKRVTKFYTDIYEKTI